VVGGDATLKRGEHWRGRQWHTNVSGAKRGGDDGKLSVHAGEVGSFAEGFAAARGGASDDLRANSTVISNRQTNCFIRVIPIPRETMSPGSYCTWLMSTVSSPLRVPSLLKRKMSIS
jgi:hypothetical protein